MDKDIPEPGDLKWAKLQGHPWWPGIVCNCPQALTHVRDTRATKQVHIQFYNNPPSRAWIKVKQVRTFLGKDDPDCRKGGPFYNSKKTLTSALVRAEKAQFMTAEERLAEVSKDKNGGGKGKKRKREQEQETAVSSPKKRLLGPKSKQRPGQNQRPGPKSKTRQQHSEETFKYNDRHIPKDWKTAYVLMNTNDIPEDLTPAGSVVLNSNTESPKKVRRQSHGVPEEEVEEAGYDNDDSDGDPGWTTDDKEDSEEGEDQVEDSDEDLSDSDKDPGWEPGGAKPLDVPMKPKQFGLKGRGRKKGVSKLTKPSTSLKSTDPTSATKSKKHASQSSTERTEAPAASKKASTGGTQPDSTAASKKAVVVHDNTPSGPEPDIGDFLFEKDECKNGDIPFLWRYKKSGLIQKYEKVVEKGKTLYECLLNYSDWWGCYAHKFEKVKVQVMYKYRNKEKVAITELPDFVKAQLPRSKSKSPGAKKASPKADKSVKASTTASKSASSKENEQTQEQEISSTTPEVEFQVGSFVLDMKDQRNVDNFAIWKIESQILLKKYEPFVKDGKILHKAVKTYRGYKEISKSYVPVKVKKDQSNDDLVEVKEDSKPKLGVDANMEETYDKNPLLRHFYVYLQVFLSQALEPGFLDEINKNKDSTYTFPLGEIDKLIKQKSTNIERKARWTSKVKNAVMKCPYLRQVPKPDEKKTCEAITDSKDTVEETVFLFGSEYDTDTLKQSGSSHPCQEFRIGTTAISYISTYHQLCHFKYNLYDKCLAKIKIIRETATDELDVTKIMDSCLGNKAWVLQNFEDFMKLVELS